MQLYALADEFLKAGFLHYDVVVPDRHFQSHKLTFSVCRNGANLAST